MAAFSWVGTVSGSLAERGNFLLGLGFAVASIVKSTSHIVVTGDASALAGQTITLYGTTASDGDYTVTTAVHTTTTLLTVTSNTGLTDQVGAGGFAYQNGIPSGTDTLTILAALPSSLGSGGIPHNVASGTYGSTGSATLSASAEVDGGNFTSATVNTGGSNTFGGGTFGTVADTHGGNTFSAGCIVATLTMSGTAANTFNGGTFTTVADNSAGSNTYSGGTYGTINDNGQNGGNTYSGDTFGSVLMTGVSGSTDNTFSGGSFGTIQDDTGENIYGAITVDTLEIKSGLNATIGGNIDITNRLSLDGGTTWLYNPTGPSIRTDVPLDDILGDSLGPWPVFADSIGPYPRGSTLN